MASERRNNTSLITMNPARWWLYRLIFSLENICIVLLFSPSRIK